MGSLCLDGTAVSASIYQDLQARSARLKEITSTIPVLATILVGDDPSSRTYVNMKGKACLRAGIESRRIELPGSSTTDEVLKTIHDLNQDSRVYGILLQHPVPPQVDEQACFNAIDTAKDVDGVNNLSFARMAMGLPAFGSATPAGIMSLLDAYRIPLSGRLAVVVGRSPILGKPLAMMLLNQDATVMLCHSRTQGIKELCRQADILCVGVGKPRLVDASWVKPGAVVVDAGYNPGNVGDTDLESIRRVCSAYTPVPGGVGPMTIATLIRQTMEAAESKLLT